MNKEEYKNIATDIYQMFLEKYPVDIEITKVSNINEYYIFRGRVINLYEEERYEEFLKVVSIFADKDSFKSEMLMDIINDYKKELKENIKNALDDSLNNTNPSSNAYSVLKNISEVFNSEDTYNFDVKLELLWSYLDTLQNLNFAPTNIRNNINMFFYIESTIKTNIINKEKEKLVDASVSAIDENNEKLVTIGTNIGYKLAQESVEEDINTVATDSASFITGSFSTKEEKKEFLDVAASLISSKVDLAQQELDKIVSNYKELLKEIKKKTDLAKILIKLKSNLNNLKVFKKYASITLKDINQNVVSNAEKFMGKITTDIDKINSQYKKIKHNVHNYGLSIKTYRQGMKETLKEYSLKREKEKGSTNIFDSIKNIKNKIKNKIEQAKTNKKKMTKNQIASLIGASIIGLSGQASNIDAFAQNNNHNFNINEIVDEVYDTSVEIAFSLDIDKVVKQVRNSSSSEVQNYISLIENLKFNSNNKKEIIDSLLYSLGQCAANWDDNCVVFGVNEKWQQRMNKIANTVSQLESIDLVNKEDVTWKGITYNIGENTNNISISLNENFNGNMTSLIHECVHAEQKKFVINETVSGTKGEMPNDEQMEYFLEEFHANFVGGLAKTYFLSDGFSTYKDIEGQGMGLVLIVGSNEFLDFMTNNSQNETFPNFVRRRFMEQGYSKEDAEDYLVALQNSLIGTLNTYNVGFKQEIVGKTPFEIRANESYQKELANFKENAETTFLKNYKKLSDIVFKVIKDRLEHAKTSEEITKALYNIGTYYDHIAGNETLYVYAESTEKGKADTNSYKVYGSKDFYGDKQESLTTIYNTMYTACHQVVKNFSLPYDEFVEIFDGYQPVENLILTTKEKNNEYITEKNATIVASNIEANVSKLLSNKEVIDVDKLIEQTDIENKINENASVINTINGIEPNEAIKQAEKISNEQSINKKQYNKADILASAQKFFDVALELELYVKEQVYAFMDRMNQYIDEEDITLEEASQIVDDLQNGKITLGSVFRKFASINEQKQQQNGGKTR